MEQLDTRQHEELFVTDGIKLTHYTQRSMLQPSSNAKTCLLYDGLEETLHITSTRVEVASASTVGTTSRQQPCSQMLELV
jgi:hypothetical protein